MVVPATSASSEVGSQPTTTLVTKGDWVRAVEGDHKGLKKYERFLRGNRVSPSRKVNLELGHTILTNSRFAVLGSEEDEEEVQEQRDEKEDEVDMVTESQESATPAGTSIMEQ
ncbi:hypothetical protein DY000_02053840 [Brassica cretica]|uniref:Uncharacterized protein n=1 Tax=Brassica cretica TaxID=69181 RepID=A0ABQ7A728_BRACR|nr:hypothetical protein DY000_02053840 [Brassica cretica]